MFLWMKIEFKKEKRHLIGYHVFAKENINAVLPFLAIYRQIRDFGLLLGDGKFSPAINRQSPKVRDFEPPKLAILVNFEKQRRFWRFLMEISKFLANFLYSEMSEQIILFQKKKLKFRGCEKQEILVQIIYFFQHINKKFLKQIISKFFFYVSILKKN